MFCFQTVRSPEQSATCIGDCPCLVISDMGNRRFLAVPTGRWRAYTCLVPTVENVWCLEKHFLLILFPLQEIWSHASKVLSRALSSVSQCVYRGCARSGSILQSGFRGCSSALTTGYLQEIASNWEKCFPGCPFNSVFIGLLGRSCFGTNFTMTESSKPCSKGRGVSFSRWDSLSHAHPASMWKLCLESCKTFVVLTPSLHSVSKSESLSHNQTVCLRISSQCEPCPAHSLSHAHPASMWKSCLEISPLQALSCTQNVSKVRQSVSRSKSCVLSLVILLVRSLLLYTRT